MGGGDGKRRRLFLDLDPVLSRWLDLKERSTKRVNKKEPIC